MMRAQNYLDPDLQLALTPTWVLGHDMAGADILYEQALGLSSGSVQGFSSSTQAARDQATASVLNSSGSSLSNTSIADMLFLSRQRLTLLRAEMTKAHLSHQRMADKLFFASLMEAASSIHVETKTNDARRNPRCPLVLYSEHDDDNLSQYQCLLRKQIEIFEAGEEDVKWNAQGRNKSIVLKQVGLRCRYCAELPTWSRSRGAVYYTMSMAGQNLAKNHIFLNCSRMPKDVKQKLLSLRDCKRRATGGKKYWADRARAMGTCETAHGLRFEKSAHGSPVTPRAA
eukprot:Nitzschia sp. Nitz4//scaffold7_size249615//75228//76400//NITZ4_001159-RA/size249615-processed-gene-0.342-mRNA-1//-1//CDS//3329558388//6083//frame0